MSIVPAEPLVYEFTRHLPARITIEPGTELTLDTEDALSGQLRKPTDRRDKVKMPKSNPNNGPIEIRGAEPGDAVAVHIQSIEPLIGACATYIGGPRGCAEWLGTDFPHGTRICKIANGMIHWNDRVQIPYRPMLGCVGTAPDWGVPSTALAGNFGGNMDLVEVCPGNTVYLPVYVPGGWLYLGDAHAAQGHGELSATALEMPARTTVRIDLVKQAKLVGPRIESPEEIMAVAVGTPIDRSVCEAYSRLILWMEKDFGWNRWDAYDLMTQAGTISLGHYLVGTIAAKISKHYL